jgi:acetyltransferase
MHVDVERLSTPSAGDRRDLTALLCACVQDGASIGFLAPLSIAEATGYWDRVLADLPGGLRILLAVRDPSTGLIVGAAQLALESRPNGRHRAEVQKVMVLPSHRRRGIAARLMLDLEAIAWTRGVTLLFLDTSDGPGGARAFYDALGYAYVGGIPGYALDPDGTPCRNAIFYKTLAPGA